MLDKDLTKLEKFKIYKDVIQGLLLHKQKRNKNIVQDLYESGIYKLLKQNELWNMSLDNLLLIDFDNVDEQDKVIMYENKNRLVWNYRNTI